MIAQLQEDNENLQGKLDAQANKLTSLEKASQFASAAKSAVEKELAEEKKKRVGAEEMVEMLRGNLEESRKMINNLKNVDKRSSTGTGMGTGSGLGLMSPLTGTYGEGVFGSTVTLKDTPINESRSPGRDSHGFVTGFKMGSSRASPDNTTDKPDITPTKSIPSSGSRGSGLRELRLGTGSVTSPSPSPSRTSSSSSLEPGFMLHTNRPGVTRPLSASRIESSPSKSRSNVIAEENEEEYPTGSLQQQITPTKPNLSRIISTTSATSSSNYERDGDVGRTNLSVADDQFSISSKNAELEASAAAEALKAEVAILKGKLAESQEARESSESALKALREFMSSGISTKEGSSSSTDAELIAGASGANSLIGIKLPPLPTDENIEDEEEAIAKAANAALEARRPSTWRSPSFSMWKSSSSAQQQQPSNRKVSNPPSFNSYDRKTSLAPSITPSLTPSTGSVSTSSDTGPMSPPISETDKELPETPNTGSTGLGSFVASWSKNITGVVIPTTPVTPAIEEAPPAPAPATAPIPVTPDQGRFAGPAVKRAFSFFSPATSRGPSVPVPSTEESNEIKLEPAAALTETEKVEKAEEEAKLDSAIAEASEQQEAGTPKAVRHFASFTGGHGHSPSDINGASGPSTSPKVALDDNDASSSTSSPFKADFSCDSSATEKDTTLFDSDDEHEAEASAAAHKAEVKAEATASAAAHQAEVVAEEEDAAADHSL